MTKNESAVERFKRWEREIPKCQRRLRERSPEHPLLRMVEVDPSWGILYNFSVALGSKYTGRTQGEALDLYLVDLKSEVERG